MTTVRDAAVQAVKDHPSTTFMAPYESLADAVLVAAEPLIRAAVLTEAYEVAHAEGMRLNALEAEIGVGPYRGALGVARLLRKAAEAQPATSLDSVLAEVRAERARQDARWGEQNHPDGTGLPIFQHSVRRYRDTAERNAAAGVLAWRDVLLEEVHEVLAESDPAELRAELVQVAAVAAAWAEAIDRRTAAGEAKQDGTQP
ncbi:hypothetical protein ACFVAF_37010 [Streptomyces sp. NPDC057596]|uniref:hypothetical protein n=1 Tax=Streptomyces sp. NPDC057596 TaxID=3346178 RepID=UPI003696B64E